MHTSGQQPDGRPRIAWGLVLRWIGLSVLLTVPSVVAAALGLAALGFGRPVVIVLVTGILLSRRRHHSATRRP